MPIRAAACAFALLILSAGCAAKRVGGTAAPPQASRSSPAEPPNALVPSSGEAGAIALSPADRSELDRVVAGIAPPLRAHLRYAFASTDDGKRRLVVYDGQGLGADGRPKNRPHEYTVFRVLNARRDEHYDPLENAIVAPIPPPAQRDGAPLPGER